MTTGSGSPTPPAKPPKAAKQGKTPEEIRLQAALSGYKATIASERANGKSLNKRLDDATTYGREQAAERLKEAEANAERLRQITLSQATDTADLHKQYADRLQKQEEASRQFVLDVTKNLGDAQQRAVEAAAAGIKANNGNPPRRTFGEKLSWLALGLAVIAILISIVLMYRKEIT